MIKKLPDIFITAIFKQEEIFFKHMHNDKLSNVEFTELCQCYHALSDSMYQLIEL